MEQQTYTHALVQAHARSRMTGARRQACMKTHKSIIRARWNSKHSLHTCVVQAHARSRMTGARRQACMKTHSNPSSGLDETAKIQTCARASTRSLTYDECAKAGMYENTHKSIIRARWNSKHTHMRSCKHTLAHV